MNVTALRLRMLRKEKKMSQQQVADVLGITRTAYNKYESGVITPSRKLRELMDLFGVSADYLLGRDAEGATATREDSHVEGQFRKYLGLSEGGAASSTSRSTPSTRASRSSRRSSRARDISSLQYTAVPAGIGVLRGQFFCI